jgi:hypothetical protein
MTLYRWQMAAVNRGEREAVDPRLWHFANIRQPARQPKPETPLKRKRGRPKSPIRDSLIAGMVHALRQAGEKVEAACELVAEEIHKRRGGSFSAKRVQTIYYRELSASGITVRAEAQMWIMELPGALQNEDGTWLAIFRGRELRVRGSLPE